MSVLILASPQDVHAQDVSKHLNELGVEFTFWSLERLLKDTRLTISLSPRAEGGPDPEEKPVPSIGVSLTPGNEPAREMSQFRSIWYRRAGFVKSVPMPEMWMESLVEWESTKAVEGVFRTVPSFWVNHPAREREASHKVCQLEVARQSGLTIPDTLITNDPEEVRLFYQRHSGQVIYKFIDESSSRFLPAYEVPRGIPTLDFKASDLSHLHQVNKCMHLFQERIQKTFDIRVTVIGTVVFAVEIHSQEGAGNLDWRLDYSVPMRAHELPADVTRGLFRLMKRLDLVYGAIDLCLTPQGDYVFFEINPSGQYLWMETALNLPMSRELANLLARGEMEETV